MTETSSRRTDTRTRIVETAARLLQERGPAAVTTRAVAEAAGVQAPAIYRLFGDKDGLLEAVAERTMATHVSAKAAVVAAASSGDVDPLEDLRDGWAGQIGFGLSNPALFHLMSDPARAAQSPALKAGREVLRARVRRLAETGRLRVSEERAAELIHAAGVGTVTALLTTPPADRDPGLADAMLESVLAQILTETTELKDDAWVAVTLRAAAPQLEVLSAAERSLLVEWLDRVIAANP
ncbi:TetR family transcriptional regulator [Kineosporia sp. NBRC 101677]|uniref:TetR/AcrR family transcriptional regulator n=1 Tax=Kineosporia sp. NBRC 101677 TaxID=3032197 RepID=UPI0024A47484|nr:TetR/AcrR family transcriptional regulator [Kineosporia sp. NBRC 101677]GLY14971.1 TetR family transcriptional regulator [Kineosporia sp. NBRC 101677]